MITLQRIWRDDTQQQLWRRILNATGFPGRSQSCAELLDDAPAWLGALATLCDSSQTLCDWDDLLDADARRLLGAHMVEIGQASFILAQGARPPQETFEPALGTVYRPDRGATLVLVAEQLGSGALTLELSGPGVPPTAPQQLALTGVDPAWLQRRDAWCRSFPVGIDLLICDHTTIVALPRTTRIDFEPSAKTHGG